MSATESQQPLVSIIIPMFNRESVLSATLQSCLDQTYQRFEIIIVDDGSTDGSVELARQWSRSDERIRIFVQPENRGAAAARNLGVHHSAGTWLQFLDSDDRLTETLIADMIQAAQQLDDCANTVIHSSYCRVNVLPDGTLEDPVEVPAPVDKDGNTLLAAYRDWYFTSDAPLTHCSMLFPRHVVERFPYDEDLPGFEDFDLLLRMLLNDVRFVRSESDGRFLYLQREHSRVTNDRMKMRRSHLGVILNLAASYPEKFRDYPHAKAMLRFAVRHRDLGMARQVLWLVHATRCNLKIGKSQRDFRWLASLLSLIPPARRAQ